MRRGTCCGVYCCTFVSLRALACSCLLSDRLSVRRTLSQCSAQAAHANDTGFFATLASLDLHPHGDHWHVDPRHPICAGQPGWAQLDENSLSRFCQGTWMHVSVLESLKATNESAAVRAGVVASMNFADGGHCTTHLARLEDDHEHAVVAAHGASADWSTWVYSMVAVAICSVISLSGILLMSLARGWVQSHMSELLALSCGTFLGSVFFSLLPETSHALGFDVEITAVMLGGVLFGMLSESVLHNLGDLFCKPAKTADQEEHAEHTKPPALEMIRVCSTDNKCSPDPPTGCDAPDHTLVVRVHQAPHASLPQGEPCQMLVGETVECADGECVQFHCDAPVPPQCDASKDAQSDGAHKHVDVHHSHAHIHGGESLSDPRQAALINCVADAFHNFIDGALIGTTFLVSPSTGWTTTIAIALHELPQELSDFALLTHAGLSTWQAALVNLLVSFTAFLGAIIAIAVGDSFAHEVTNVLPFAAGLFFYLALALLMPQMLHVKGWRRVAKVWFAFALGVGLMAVLLALPWEHSHGDAHGDHGDDHSGHNH